MLRVERLGVLLGLGVVVGVGHRAGVGCRRTEGVKEGHRSLVMASATAL